jgi:hypothetical protein
MMSLWRKRLWQVSRICFNPRGCANYGAEHFDKDKIGISRTIERRSQGENQMKRGTVKMIALGFLALALALGTARNAEAQDAKNPYPSMASLDQYLIPDRNAEIALARTAAPPSVSNDATVMVLGKQGYETAVEGKNGFVCLVERGWNGPFEGRFTVEFWNPKGRGPDCLNPPPARTVLPILLMRTKLVVAGKSKDEIHESMKAAVEKKELPALEPGGMAYMLSKQGHLNDLCGNCFPHLMFYVPLKDAKTWGADAPGSPVMVNYHYNGAPEPVTEFMVPVSEWSDGTPASTDAP